MEEIKEYLSRLQTIKNRACDERVTTQTIYNRIRKGEISSVEIDGIKFVVNDMN